jgi:outer membrane protein assembly factor BamB
MMVRSMVIGLSLLSLTACELFLTEDEIRLPGRRVAVLVDSRTVNADPQLASAQILLPAPVPNSQWPQAGGFANHAMHHMVLGPSIKRNWITNIGIGASDEARLVSEPIVAKGMVFALDSTSRITAVDAETGRTLWSKNLSPETEEDDGHIPGGVAYYSNHLYVTTGFGDVISLNAKSGEIVWRKYILSPMRSAPTLRNGRVLVLTIDNRILALDSKDGNLLWEQEGVGISASLLGGASPAIDQNIVVVPYSSGELVAYDLNSGRLLWSYSLTSVRHTNAVSSMAHILANPVIDRGLVFSISHAGTLAALDLKTGERIWDRNIGGIGNLWVAGDYIFLLSNDAEIISLSRNSGRVYWVRNLPQFEDPEDKDVPIIWSGPVLASDRLIITGSHGQAWAISPYSGDILGSIDLPDGVSVPPVIANRSVFFLTDDASIVAYK